MRVRMYIEIPDPNQELDLDDGLDDDQIDELVKEFAADHVANTHHVEWYKDED